MALQPKERICGIPLIQFFKPVCHLCLRILFRRSGHSQRIHMIKDSLFIPGTHVVVFHVFEFSQQKLIAQLRCIPFVDIAVDRATAL